MPDSVCKLLGKVCAGDGLAGGFGFIAVHTAPHCHCPQHHFRVFQIVAVQGDAVLRLPGLHPFREFFRDTVALLEKEDVRGDFGSGVGLERIAGQSDCA